MIDLAFVSSFINYCVNETCRKNSNVIIFIEGKSGRGKSYASMKIGELVTAKVKEHYNRSLSFGINNLCWDVKALLRCVKDDVLPNGEKIGRGGTLIMEEVGVTANNREWHSVNNQVLNFISQTYRRNNYVTIFNAPDVNFVDISVRKTIHLILRARGVKHGDYAEFSVRVPFVDAFGRLQYRPFFVYDEALGKSCPLRSIRFGLPSQELLRDYEEMKKTFNEALYHRLEGQLNALDTKLAKASNGESYVE